MAYLARRTSLGLLTIWLVSVAAFVLLQLAPGDAATAVAAGAPGEGGLTGAELQTLREDLGLNRSWPVRYADWFASMARFDPGVSLVSSRPVADEIGPGLAVTAELAVLALVLAVLVGVTGGLAAAATTGSWPDYAIRGTAFAALSVPTFWLSLVVVLVTASWTGYFIALGYQPFSQSPASNMVAILPAASVLALRPAATAARVTRISTLEAASMPYFTLARLSGHSRPRALFRHAFRTSLLPLSTVVGGQLVFMLGGSIVVEQVFGLPGTGRLLVDAVLSRDFPVVQALVVIYATAAVGINLAVDLLYMLLDPRVRVSA